MRAQDPSAPPLGWAAKVNSIGPGRAALFGTFLTVTNFSSLPLYISGLKEIVTANIGTARSVAVLALFVTLIEVALLVPIVSYALAPRRAGVVLSTVLRWIEKNNRTICILVFFVFGVFLLVKGIVGFQT